MLRGACGHLYVWVLSMNPLISQCITTKIIKTKARIILYTSEEGHSLGKHVSTCSAFLNQILAQK